MRAGPRAALLAALVISGPAAWAELPSEAYLGLNAIHSAAERARVQAEIDAARQREAEAEARREREAAEARRRAAEAEALADVPAGRRLITHHCTGCHGPETFAATRHGWLGWRLTVARMRWLHRAPLPPGAAAPITAYLVETQPAAPARVALEFGLAAAPLALPVVWWLRRRRSSRVRPAPGSARAAARPISPLGPETPMPHEKIATAGRLTAVYLSSVSAAATTFSGRGT